MIISRKEICSSYILQRTCSRWKEEDWVIEVWEACFKRGARKSRNEEKGREENRVREGIHRYISYHFLTKLLYG